MFDQCNKRNEDNTRDATSTLNQFKFLVLILLSAYEGRRAFQAVMNTILDLT